jgi:hypothetical protein
MEQVRTSSLSPEESLHFYMGKHRHSGLQGINGDYCTLHGIPEEYHPQVVDLLLRLYFTAELILPGDYVRLWGPGDMLPGYDKWSGLTKGFANQFREQDATYHALKWKASPPEMVGVIRSLKPEQPNLWKGARISSCWFLTYSDLKMRSESDRIRVGGPAVPEVPSLVLAGLAEKKYYLDTFFWKELNYFVYRFLPLAPKGDGGLRLQMELF